MPAGKQATRTESKIKKMLLGLSRSDRQMLEDLVKRYRTMVAMPNMAWVLRQLIRNAHGLKKLPPVVTGDDED